MLNINFLRNLCQSRSLLSDLNWLRIGGGICAILHSKKDLAPNITEGFDPTLLPQTLFTLLSDTVNWDNILDRRTDVCTSSMRKPMCLCAAGWHPLAGVTQTAGRSTQEKRFSWNQILAFLHGKVRSQDALMSFPFHFPARNPVQSVSWEGRYGRVALCSAL